jgi:putative drug exporter of the RND superfamily
MHQARIFDRLGVLVSRHWFAVLLGWAALLAVTVCFAPHWDDVTKDGDFAYLPAAMTSVQGERLLEAAFPEALSKSQVIFVVCRSNGPLGPPDYDVADRLVEQCTPGDDAAGPILGVLSHQTEVVGEKLKSHPGPQGQASLIVLQLRNEFAAVANMELLGQIHARLDVLRRAADFPPGLQIGLTGSAAVGTDILFAAEESIRNTERTTILLVIVILLLVYRAPGLVVIPLVTIFVSLTIALGLVAWISQASELLGWFDYKIFKTSRIFIVVILFGAGTDFCLFLIARYKEELQRMTVGRIGNPSGAEPTEALGHALGRVGGALAASAMTTILGLAVMAFADFGKFRYSGPTIAFCLAVGLAASLTLTPAMLRAAGMLVFWPSRTLGRVSPRRVDSVLERPSQVAEPGSGIFRGFWEWLSRQVVGHPKPILGGALLVMLPLAYHGFGIQVTYDLLSELRHERPSVQGTKLLQRYFPAGETGPITVLAYQESGKLDASEQAREKIRRLSQRLYALEYRDAEGSVSRPITSVRSLVEPLGERPERYGLFSGFRKGIARGHRITKSTYLAQSPQYAGKLTRLDIITGYDPFSAESMRFLDHLEQWLGDLSDDPKSEWRGAEFHFLGTTAGIRDLKRVTASDLVLIQQLVPIVVLAVLVVLLGRAWISVYLILTVLLGYYVSIGATNLWFAWLYGQTYVGLDWKVPMFLFVILIAVGEDYNIYLATRVFEEQARRGALEGLRVALVRTGGIITSCGVIMAGTFASMMAGTLRATTELGLALAFGVLLDTFVIRTIIVPAFLAIWDRNLPSPFGRGAGGEGGLNRRKPSP